MQKAGLIRQKFLKKKDVKANVCKVRKMLLIVECEYLTEDSKVRLYLSQVQEIRNPAARIFQKKASLIAAKLILSMILTAPAAAWSIIYAFIERGYKDYGGEYLFILTVFGAVYWALGRFLSKENKDIL